MQLEITSCSNLKCWARPSHVATLPQFNFNFNWNFASAHKPNKDIL